MDRAALRTALHQLAREDRRAEAAQVLATALGAERLLLYVKDPALDVMLPAPGMPKTLRGGPRWREFLHRCLRETRPGGVVDVPPEGEASACALSGGGAALILLGGSAGAVPEAIADDFPLLAGVLVAQQALHLERAEAADARSAAAQSHNLAQALDRARAASAELNLQLRHEHERKDEFLAMLAHELRNPLSPLVNSIEILWRRGAGGDEQIARQLDVMTRQLQQLTRLVDDLLDVSRVSRGLIELRRERLLLEDVLEDAAEVVRPMMESRAHAFHRGSAPEGLTVLGDRVRLTQVFANVLANAAKYTDPGGRISLSVIVDERRVSVVVKDNGMGIPQEMLSRVFDMFAQVPMAQARSQGGLGIGLTLARRLVELHGGHVSAYSRGPGEGSTFTVSLPQVVPASGPVPAPAVAPAVEASSAAMAAGTRVLVVDDNPDCAESLGALVGVMGAEVRIAHDGHHALLIAQEFGPDLILLDIGLPGMDGYEVARRLRQLPNLRAQLVALTGYGSAQDRERALEAGFDDHRVKPLAVGETQQLLCQLPAMQADS